MHLPLGKNMAVWTFCPFAVFGLINIDSSINYFLDLCKMIRLNIVKSKQNNPVCLSHYSSLPWPFCTLKRFIWQIFSFSDIWYTRKNLDTFNAVWFKFLYYYFFNFSLLQNRPLKITRRLHENNIFCPKKEIYFWFR